jgi:hypothetical protein
MTMPMYEIRANLAEMTEQDLVRLADWANNAPVGVYAVVDNFNKIHGEINAHLVRKINEGV